jgi:hypothetical protein
MISDPAAAHTMLQGLQLEVAERGFWGLYEGFVPIMLRQV